MSLNRRLLGQRQHYQPMELINVRMPDDLVAALECAARDNQRTLRDQIRHILWSALARRGYLAEHDELPLAS